MQRHKFNIFPEMQPEDYIRLKNDMAKNGYDSTMPIMIYQGEIIDGWNRQRACNDLVRAEKVARLHGRLKP